MPEPARAMPEAARASPEAEAARMRIYLGAAPGVGKTWRMLEDAHSLRSLGLDVAVALVEPHGRDDVAALVGDLPVIPLREVTHRSITLRELDLDAILARRPHIVVIDELAHTNIPGSRNRKRYEDVIELLEAGIHVLTAVNVQHIETLNDAVARSSDTAVLETVPDSFLKRANEVLHIDITVEELRNRLRAGKIYPPEKVESALANFFRKGNLNLLRELALRTTADQVGTAAAHYRRTQGLEQAPIPEKVMVCLSPRPGTERLLRAGARIAARLSNRWFAVRVQPPKGTPTHMPAADLERLEGFQRLARELGGEVVVLEDRHVADALIAFAKRESISHVVFGQSARSRVDILLRGSVLNRFLSEVRDTSIHVVPMSKEKRPERNPEKRAERGHPEKRAER